jgi:hypothetical protein
MRDMKANKNKMKFNYAGMTFEVPAECLRTTDYWGKPLETPYINIGRKEVASMSKAFVKKNYPNLMVWGSSETFANGNSVSVYVCNSNGSDLDIESKEWKEIAGFVHSLSGGKYNGWDEIYEYGDGFVTENGTKIESWAKYVHCNNAAPHGTWPSAIKCLKGLIAGEYVFGPLSIEKAIEKAKGYGYSESNITKALGLI